VPAKGQAGFTQLDPGHTGVTFQNYLSDSAALRNQVLAQGGGVALGDVDGDGLVDVFLVKTEGQSALYRNRGGFRFEDLTTRAGLDTRGRSPTGAVLADVDGDGDLDLLISALAGPTTANLNADHG